MKKIVQVYRSPRHEGMYLIVDRASGLASVPESLLARFGAAQASFVFSLDESRRLAHADPEVVLAAIDAKGFYLQMPPEPVSAEDQEVPE